MGLALGFFAAGFFTSAMVLGWRLAAARAYTVLELRGCVRGVQQNWCALSNRPRDSQSQTRTRPRRCGF